MESHRGWVTAESHPNSEPPGDKRDEGQRIENKVQAQRLSFQGSKVAFSPTPAHAGCHIAVFETPDGTARDLSLCHCMWGIPWEALPRTQFASHVHLWLQASARCLGHQGFHTLPWIFCLKRKLFSHVLPTLPFKSAVTLCSSCIQGRKSGFAHEGLQTVCHGEAVSKVSIFSYSVGKHTAIGSCSEKDICRGAETTLKHCTPRFQQMTYRIVIDIRDASQG